MSWWRKAREHHDHAHRECQEFEHHDLTSRGPWLGVTKALLALVAVNAAGVLELRRIRKVLEAEHSNQTVRLNLTGHVVSKEGNPMPAGPFNPTETEDVALAISPVNAAGEPTSGPFTWTVSDGAAGTLEIAADTKSAKLVTALGSIDAVVVVTDPRTGVSDTAAVQRTVTPPDNNTVNLNLAGSLAPKA